MEIKSFLGNSEVDDLEQALGQFVLYRAILAVREPSRTLFLAVPEDMSCKTSFDEPNRPVSIVKDQCASMSFGFDPQAEVITRWIP